MGVVQGLVVQALGLAIGIVLSLIVLPFDILREGLKKVVVVKLANNFAG